MVGFGETYFSAYALYLGANNFQMGILTCLPPFLAGLCQFFTIRLLKKYGVRKKLILTGVGLQALALLPLLLLPHIHGLRMEVYIFIVTLYFATNNTISPIWNSWMGDLVSPNKRGIYFGRRNKMITIGTFLSMTLAGLILRSGKEDSHEIFGFYIIFVLAFLSRMVSFKFLTKKYDPPLKFSEPPRFDFFKHCRELKGKNYGMLILSMVTVNFGVFIAAAYYTPHLIKHLKVDYFTYTGLLSAVLLFKYLSSSFWGEVVDTMGAKKVVVWCSLLICFTTWPWLITSNIIVICLAQCYTGIVWAGYELSTFTFLLDATEPEERTQVTSFFNILNTTTGFVGGVLGALFVTSMKGNSVLAFKTVFATTSVIRLISFFTFSGKLKETRVLAQVKTADVLLKASGFKSTLGMTSRLVVFSRKK